MPSVLIFSKLKNKSFFCKSFKNRNGPKRGKNRNAAGLFARKPETGTQQYKQGISNLFSGAGVSFEEFAREKNQEEGVPSPKSRDEEIASPKNARRGYTPLTFKDRKRSGVGSEKSDN